MSMTRTFNSYNFVTGAIDGTLAYDFSSPRFFPQEEVYEQPAPSGKSREQEWVKENKRERIKVAALVRSRQGFSPLAVMGTALVIVLFVMSLLAQIQLVNISQRAVEMERQITALESERDRLMVEYESVFNLKDVEEYAVGVLGMQEPRDDQVYYLSGVSSADKAVVITSSDGSDMLALGLEDIVASVKSYFD